MKNKLYLAVIWGLAGATAGEAGAAVDLFNSPVGVIGAQPGAVAADDKQAAAEIKAPQAAQTSQVAQATPAAADKTTEASAPQAAKSKLWSYQPLKAPDQPAVTNKSWVRTPIDAFVLAPLEARLRPTPIAPPLCAVQRWMPGVSFPRPKKSPPL